MTLHLPDENNEGSCPLRQAAEKENKSFYNNGGKMIKAIVAGLDPVGARAIEEVGQRRGVEIEAENVFVPSNFYAQATDFGTAYTYARLNAAFATKVAPHGTIFVGTKSTLQRKNGGWQHLVGIMIVNRYQVLLCGTWTEPVDVPLDLVEEIRNRGMSTADLETVLADRYGSNPDPYRLLSGGRSRQQMIVEALFKVADRRWLAPR